MASGTIAFPEGEDTVTVPGETVFQMATATCTDHVGANRADATVNAEYRSKIIPRYAWTANAASATITAVPIEHQHSSVATGVTGTGFYCGRHYDWSDFAPDEDRPLFLTRARRSLIGWVYVDSIGQQVVKCTAHRPIFRPADQ